MLLSPIELIFFFFCYIQIRNIGRILTSPGYLVNLNSLVTFAAPIAKMLNAQYKQQKI